MTGMTRVTLRMARVTWDDWDDLGKNNWVEPGYWDD